MLASFSLILRRRDDHEAVRARKGRAARHFPATCFCWQRRGAVISPREFADEDSENWPFLTHSRQTQQQNLCLVPASKWVLKRVIFHRCGYTVLYFVMSSTGPVNAPDVNEISTQEVFLICGGLVAILIVLLFLRFLVVLLIDVVILQDFERAKRSIAELGQKLLICRRCCPSLPREPNDEEESGMATTSRRRQQSNNNATLPCSIDVELSTSSSRLNELLPSRTMTQDDLDSVLLQDQHQCTLERIPPNKKETRHNDADAVTTACTCSICLHDLQVGDSVYQTAQCHHWFHADCIRAWLVSHTRRQKNNNNNNHCPNCRTPLVDPAVLRKFEQEP